MLFKIIWRSFLRQTRNYVVYFLCMMTAVMIFYSFSAMTYDQPLTRRAQQDIQIDRVLSLGNIVVGLVVLVFMLSANQFFVQQRQKEIGLYQLFGLRKVRIMYQFLIEAVFLNVLSLIVGILMGIVFSKFFAMILIKAMDLNIGSRFFISWPSIVTTALLFLVAVSLISIQNMWLIWKKQLIELFQPQDHFSSRRLSVRWSHYLTALVSVCLIATGYYIATDFNSVTSRYVQQTNDYAAVYWIPLLIFALCVCGSYLFFAYGVQVLLFLLAKWRPFSYRQLRVFALNHTRTLLKKSWRTLSLISVIVGIAIAMIGGSIAIFSVSYRATETSQPMDFQVASEQAAQLEQLITDNGGRITQKMTMPLKVTGAYTMQKNEFMTEETRAVISVTDLLSESQYQQLRQFLPDLPAVTIKEKNGALLFDSNVLSPEKLTTREKRVILPNRVNLQVEQAYPDLFGESLLRYGYRVLVVKDPLYQRIEGETYELVYLNAKGYDQETFQQSFAKELPPIWGNDLKYQYQYRNGVLTGTIQLATQADLAQPVSSSNSGILARLNQTSRYVNIRSARRQGGIFMYVALFVGMVVLITTASTLMVRQFYEASREKKNYQFLRQLGIPRKFLRRAVYQQNAWIFLPTMLIATSHGGFAILMMTRLIRNANYWVAYLFCFLTIFIFTAAYFLTTSFYLRMIEE